MLQIGLEGICTSFKEILLKNMPKKFCLWCEMFSYLGKNISYPQQQAEPRATLSGAESNLVFSPHSEKRERESISVVSALMTQ